MGLLDDEEQFGNQEGLPEYGRPSSTFSEESQASSYSPAQDRAFSQMRQNFDYRDGVRENAASFGKVLGIQEDAYKKYVDNQVAGSYFQLVGDQPPQGYTGQQMMDEMEAYASNEESIPFDLNALKQGFQKRTQDIESYRSRNDLYQQELQKVEQFNSMVDPMQRAAYDNWSKSSGGRKPNGKPSKLLDPKKANEILDFLNFRELTQYEKGSAANILTSDLKDLDPRLEIQGSSEYAKTLNKKQLERRKAVLRQDFDSLFGEHTRAVKLRSSGMHIAPSWNNQIGGVDRMVGSPDERKAVMLSHALEAGVDYFTDENGEQRDIKEWMASSEYSPQEVDALKMMNALGQARTKYNDMALNFWAGLKDISKKEESEGWNELELVRQQRDTLAQGLSSMGYGESLFSRAESIQDVGMWSGWLKTGLMQADIADFSDNLVGSADNMSVKDFEALSRLASQQDYLGELMQKNGNSPLANLMAMSQKEQDGWFEAVGRWFSMDGVKAVAELAVTNLSGFLPEYIETAPATVGTTTITGALVGGPAGAATGLTLGLKANWGVASATMEYAANILQMLKEEGVDVHNPKVFAAAWANDSLRKKLQIKAAKKTGMVALFDTISAGMAGKVNAVMKSPSTLTKIPSSLAPKNRNLTGLSVEQTQRLKDLRKQFKKNKFQEGSKEFAELEKLEGGVRGGFFSQSQSPFSKAIDQANSRVDRTTGLMRARNASVELGFGAGTGMAGEGFGQLLSREPGEAIDKQAILAEGIGEIAGPGTLGAVYETVRAPDLRFTQSAQESSTPIEPTDSGDPYSPQGKGLRESMNNNGWKYEKVSFDNPIDSVSYLAKQGNLPLQIKDPKAVENLPSGRPGAKSQEPKFIDNPEIQFLKEFVTGVEGIMDRKNLKVKYVVSDRTPEGSDNIGYMNVEGGDFVVYINKKALNQKKSSIGSALIHELPHVVGTGFYGDSQVLSWYNELDDNQRLQAMSHYMFKDTAPNTPFEQLNPDQQETLKKEYAAVQQNPEAKSRAAQEWFSFEFARVLASGIKEKSRNVLIKDEKGTLSQSPSALPAGINNDILDFIDQYIYPMYSKYIGSGRMVMPDVAGPKEAFTEGTAKPEKMGPEEMYAQILYDMNWGGMGPGGQVAYQGPAKPTISGRSTIADMPSLFKNQNLLLSDERTMSTLLKVAGEKGFERVTVGQNEQDISVLDDPDSISTPQEILANFEQSTEGVMQRDALEETGNNQFTEDQEKRVRKNLERQFDRAYLKAATETDPNIQKGSKSRDRFSDQKDVETKDGPIASTRKRIENLQKALDYAKKNNKSLIPYKGKDRTQAEIRELINQEESELLRYTEPVNKRLEGLKNKLTTKNVKKDGVFKPDVLMNSKGETVTNPAAKSESLNLDQQSRNEIDSFIELFKQDSKDNKTPQQVAKALDDAIQSSPKKLKPKLEEIAAELMRDNKRVTTEEVYSRFIEDLGLVPLAEINKKGARAQLSERAEIDPESIDEAYAQYEARTERLIGTINKAIDNLDLEVQAQEQLQKELEVAEAPKAEEGSNLSDTQVTGLIRSIKAMFRGLEIDEDSPVKSKEQINKFLQDNLKGEVAQIKEISDALTDFIQSPVLSDTKDKDSLISGISKKLDVLTKDTIEGSVEATRQIAAGMEENRVKIRELLSSGAVTSVNRDASFVKIAKSKEEVAKKAKKKESLKDLKTAISIASDEGNVDYRDTPVVIPFTPDDGSAKGTNFTDLVTQDGRKVTLGDLASSTSLKVKFLNDTSGKIQIINGPQQLDKLVSNFNWDMDEKIAADFERLNPGLSYAEYATRLLAALASRRKGKTRVTKKGLVDSSFFGADQGVTKFAILFEKIERIGRALAKNSEDRSYLAMMEPYQIAIKRQERLAREKRESDPVYMERRKQLNSFYDILLGADREGKKRVGDSEDLRKIVLSKNFKKIKEGFLADKDNSSLELSMIEQIEGLVSKKGKLAKKITVADGRKLLGLGVKQMSEGVAAVEKPIPMLSKDLLNLNLTAGRIAEQFFEEDTESVGTSMYNKRVADFALSTESNLLSDLGALNEMISTGASPTKTLSEGAFISKGDVFPFRRRLYRATKSFQVSSENILRIEDFANPAERINPNTDNGVRQLSDEELKDLEVRRKNILSALDRLNQVYPDGFFASDGLSQRPTVTDQAGNLQDVSASALDILAGPIETKQYKHLVSMFYEHAAERGVNKSFVQSMPNKSKGESHMEHFHVESFAAELSLRQKKGLEDNLMTLPAAAARAEELLRKKTKTALEQSLFLDFDPEGIDKPVDMARKFIKALNDGSPRVQRLLAVEDAEGNLVTNPDDLIKLPEFQKKLAEIEALSKKGNLPIYFDNFKFKSDPIVSALSADPETHSQVRNLLEAEALKEGKRATDPITINLTQKQVGKIFNLVAIAKQGGLTTPKGKGLQVIYDPTKERFVRATYKKSKHFDPKFEELLDFDKNSVIDSVILKKGERLLLNGFSYTLKSNINLKSVEGQEILSLVSEAGPSSNRPLSSMAPEFIRLFDSKTKLFTKKESKQTLRDSEVSLDNPIISDSLNILRRALERKQADLDSLMDDPMAGNPDSVGKLESQVNELKSRIQKVEDFFNAENPIASDWELDVEHSGRIVKTKVRKEKGSWKLFYKEAGNFINPSTNRGVSEQLADVLFNMVRSKYDLIAGLEPKRMSDAQLSMSSFGLTPRELVTKVIDIGGVDNIGMLASSFGKYYGDSMGGIMLLDYLDTVPDQMLADLTKSGAVDKVLTNLKKKLGTYTKPENLKGLDKLEYDQLNTEIEFFNKIQESGLKLNEAAMVNYVSEFKIDRLKNSKPLLETDNVAGKITEQDKLRLESFLSDPDADYTFTLATRKNLNLKNNQPVKLGRVEAQKNKDGKVTSKAKDVYGVVKIKSLDEEGNVVKVDKNNKPEDFDITDDRWPTLKGKPGVEDQPQKAFLYEIEFKNLQSDSDQSIRSLLYDSDSQNFVDFKPQNIKLTAELNEALSKLSDKPEEEFRSLAKRALKNYDSIDYLYYQDGKLHNEIIEDIVNGDKMLKSKIRFLSKVVYNMGGLKLTTPSEILAEQREIDQDATRFTPDSEDISSDGQATTEPSDEGDTTDPDFKENSVGWETMFDKMDDDTASFGGLSSNYSTKMFSKTRGGNVLSLLSSAFTERYNRWRTRANNKDLKPGELDLGRTGLRGHTGIYGRFVEQFGPFLKLEKSLMSALNTDDKGLRAKGLKAYDKFYQGMGMSGSLLDEGNRMYVNPIKDALYESQAKLEDLGWYLYALVAPQANQAIKNNREQRLKKPDIVDPETGESMGSGMTNSEAQSIIERMERQPEMAKFIMHRSNPVKTMFDMHRKSLELMRDSELVTDESYQRMKNASTSKYKFKHALNVNFGDFRRLPLKGVFGDEAQYKDAEDIAEILSGAGVAAGKGFDMPRGPVKMSATGREYRTLADINTIFANSVQEYEEAVIRSMRSKSATAINNIYNELLAEKEAGNEGAKTLFDRLFQGEKTTLKKKSKEVEGVYSIDEVEVPAEIADPQLAFFVREDGEPKMIMFSKNPEGALLASAAKNLTYEQLGKWVGYLNMTTKYMSRIRTSYSPEFWLRNPIKDTMTAWFNLKESDEFSDIAGKVANPLKVSKDAMGILRYEKHLDQYGKVLGGFDKMSDAEVQKIAKNDIRAAYYLLDKHGGKTAFYKFESVPEILKSMESAAKEGREGNALKRNLKVITSAVDRLNTSLENVLRARVIQEGLKAGKDFEALITQARNVTVDFNKRGTMSQQLNAVFQFANPGIQGGRRFAKALAQRGLTGTVSIAMKIATLSFAYNFLTRILTARDDDEEDDYSTYLDDVSARQRHTGMVIPHKIFGDESKTPGYTHIPIGIGPHSFWALGEYLAKTSYSGGRHAVRDSLELASTMWQTMSPISSYPIPALDPFLDLLGNKKFTGSPIYLEGAKGAPSEASQKNTAKVYNKISDWINAMAGGDENLPGSYLGFLGKDPLEVSGQFDTTLDGKWSGSGIEFLVQQYGGSLADNIAQIINLGFEQPKDFKIPVLKGVVKTSGSGWASIGKYYDLRERYMKAKSKLDAMPARERLEFMKSPEKKHYKQLMQLINKAENQMNMYQRKKKVLEAKEQTDSVIQQLDKLEQIRINTIRGVLGKALDMGLDV